MKTCLQLISSWAVNIQVIHITQMSLQTFKHFPGKQAETKLSTRYKLICTCQSWLRLLKQQILHSIAMAEDVFGFPKGHVTKGAPNVFNE